MNLGFVIGLILRVFYSPVNPGRFNILKLSEPPAHDRWDPTASRLRLDGDQKPQIVEAVLARIKRAFRSFQNAAKPPAPPRPRRLARLERDLASWFGVGPKGRAAPPHPTSAPISLVPDGPHVHVEGDSLRATGHVKVALAPGTDLDSLPFRVRLSLRVAEEDGVSSADPIPLATTAGSRLEELEDGFWRGTVTADEPVRIDFESDPYDSSWTVQFVPEVLPVEEKSA